MPPRWNGQPAPRIRHRSMSCASATTPSSSMSRISSASAVSAFSRTCSAVSGGVADLEQRGHRRVDARRRPASGWPDSAIAAQVLADREPVRERLVQDRRRRGSATAGPTSCSRASGRIGRPERVERGVGHLQRGARVDGAEDLAEEPGQQPVDHERRRVLDQHARLAQRLADGERGGQRGVVGPLGPHDLQQRHHRDRVEEVEPDHPLGVRQVGRHRGDRQRRGVGGQHALGRDDLLQLGPDLLLDAEVLEDRLDHEVGVGEGAPCRRCR